MRRVLAPLVPLLIAMAVAPTASASLGSPRVIGGLPAATSDVPWQALVLPKSYLCGGSILDTTHIVTAAHCVYDDVHRAVTAPSDVRVHAGITDSYATGQSPTVSAVSIDPAYDPDLQTSDIAILTLATPLTFGPAVGQIALTDVGYRAAPTTDLWLSGWGSDVPRSPYDRSQDASPVRYLQVAKTLHVDATACDDVYHPFDDAKLLCAGQVNLDACQGDSGGPLAVQDGGVWKLAGVVTGGAGCAWDGYPGYYARVAEPGINAFLTQRGVGYAVQDPVNTGLPTITGTPRIGNTLTCQPGSWQNAYTYDYAFMQGGSVIGGQSTLALDASTLGASISCVVVGYGLTGSADAQSQPVTIGGAAGVQPAPTPQPSPGPTPDLTPPTARLLKIRCSHTVCILEVRADDPSPSAGIAGVDAQVSTSYRTTCGRKGHRRRCTKTIVHRLRTVTSGLASYRIITPKLRKGTQTFTLVARDMRGNRQAKATVVRKTTG